ncbi:MAG: hypothetical protein IPK99_05635 [Flavobacteriales bacterium]|nr:hypothetical protein [Flavobacteriales bacterium]
MNSKSLALMAVLTAIVPGCKKDDPAPPSGGNPAPTTANVELEIEFFNGANPYALTDVLTDSAGNEVRFDKLRFFISNAHLFDDAMNEIAHFEDAYILADASNASVTYDLGTVPAGHVHELGMFIGLDSTTNHTDPTTFTEAPLNDATMHWFWNPALGYKFMELNGYVDSNGDNVVDATDALVEYHIATDDLLGEAEFELHQDVAGGTTLTIAIHVDLAHLAAQIDLGTNPQSHTTDFPALAVRMRDALIGSMELH